MKSKQRLTSLLLAVTMVVGLVIPASAATQYGVTVKIDESTNWTNGYDSGSKQTLDLMEIGAKDVANVRISSGGDTEQHYTDYNGASGQLDNGTGYRFFVNTDSNGIGTLRCELNPLNGDVYVSVTTKATSYTIRANSGPYGSNNNQGVSGNETCSVSGSQDQTVNGGDSWSVTFTPKAGYDITHLNIRPDFNNDSLGKVVSAPGAGSSDTATIAGKSYTIEKAANGTVTLRCAEATRDIYVTALTQAAKKTYTLSVSTDSNSSSDISSTTVTEGTAKTVSLKTNSGYNIADVQITDNGSRGVIRYNESSVNVNGKTYTLTRNLDGSADLSVPAMNADVSINATATNGTHYVSVNEGRYTSSPENGVRFFRPTESYTVTFEPDRNAVIDEVVVKTSRGTYRADIYDSYIVVEGNYFRLYTDYNGDITVYLTQIPTNMEIYPVAKDTVHSVTLRTNSGCDTDRTGYDVDDGDSLKVVFEPTSSRYDITELRINYNGSTYRADPRDDSYVRVNGTRWPISVDRDGKVTLSMVDIEYDVTVTASTNSSSYANYRISKSQDSHTTVTYTGSNPFAYDDKSTITVTADNRYIIDSIKFEMGGDTATIEPFDRSFRLDGNTFYVTWDRNDEAKITIDAFTGNLKVTAKSVKGDVINNPTWQQSSYHPAYMVGYGNGRFGADNVLTRAEAVTLLSRAVTQANTNVYAYSTVFYDVSPNTWYAGAVNYAYAMGFLDFFGNGRYFYPEQPITRAEFVALLCEFSGVDASRVSGDVEFYDVPASHWAAGVISYAAEQGWVYGVGGNYFQPNRSVSRAEICAMMNRIMGREADRSRIYGQQFADVPMSHWAYYDIMEAANTHYVTGHNSDGEIWS